MTIEQKCDLRHIFVMVLNAETDFSAFTRIFVNSVPSVLPDISFVQGMRGVPHVRYGMLKSMREDENNGYSYGCRKCPEKLGI